MHEYSSVLKLLTGKEISTLQDADWSFQPAANRFADLLESEEKIKSLYDQIRKGLVVVENDNAIGPNTIRAFEEYLRMETENPFIEVRLLSVGRYEIYYPIWY